VVRIGRHCSHTTGLFAAAPYRARHAKTRRAGGLNVFFEQPTFPSGVREFVMYNPLDEHVMIVHNQDLLESRPEQVEQERWFHARAARDAGVLRWKYFWFD
jgi:hypothetical protein